MIKKRGRKPDSVKSDVVHIQGRRKHGESPRYDLVFDFLDKLPKGRKFEFTWELLAQALSGELGPAMQKAALDGDVDQAHIAAKQIFNNVVDMD